MAKKRAKVEFMQRPWAAQPLVERLQCCRFLLLLHECLSDAEELKVRKRIDKLSARLTPTTKD